MSTEPTRTVPASPPVDEWHPADDMPDPTDPVLYPKLDDRLMHAVAELATCRAYEPGELLFAHGQRDAPFFVVESGQVVFFDRGCSLSGEGVYFATVGDRMFIGDVAMFTGEPTIAECRALKPTRVLELCPQRLRKLVAEHSEAGDLILRTLLARRAWLEDHGYGKLQLIGSRYAPASFELRDFLGRNQIPFQFLNTDECGTSRALLDRLGIEVTDLPVLLGGQTVMHRPSRVDVARHLGLRPAMDGRSFDVAVIGAGPAGLAAAVYGASEGLDVAVVDADSPGGQAGTSTKIENYLGFSTGISGQELARQAVLQARKFGVTLCNPAQVQSVWCGEPRICLELDGGERFEARNVVIASGAAYRRLDAEGCQRLEGAGVYFAASHLEALQCRGEDVIVVGGGNSAGQAAVHLARYAKRVYVVVRGPSLERGMSQYLVDRIQRSPNTEVLLRTQVHCAHGDDRLEAVTLVDAEGRQRRVDCAALFVMIGARPHTDWLADCVGRDDHGFVVTGPDAEAHPDFARHWNVSRSPFLLETTRPGVFAIGDVRHGSTKRVASAVGEGAMVVRYLHELLAPTPA